MLKLLFLFLSIGCSCYAELTPNMPTKEKEIMPLNKNEIERTSIYLAHLLWRDLNNYSPYYNLDLVIRTMKELSEDKTKLIDSQECYTYLAEIGEKVVEEECRKNLSLAENFLEVIAKQPNIIELQKGKLYYEVLKPGSGIPVIKNSSPLLHFKESNLSNTVIRDTNKKAPVKLALGETIKGFSEGVIGMKEGEKRKIYVHPDLAYGKYEGQEPQQLLIFEVEILSIQK